jgi:hypothetical protein
VRCQLVQCRDETYHPKDLAASIATWCLEVARPCVIVPVCTENELRFSARLGDRDPTVRFERAVAG